MLKNSSRKLVDSFLFFVVLLIFFYSCKKDVLNGKNSLIEMTTEAPGENCSSGGLKIFEGLDENGNNVLDEDEIETVEFICNGTNGINGEDGADGENGQDGLDGGYDKKVELFFENGAGSFGTKGSTMRHMGHTLYDFDIRNYIGVDSVVFSVRTGVRGDEGAIGYLEIYDLTNEQPFESSLISTTVEPYVRMVSNNFILELPHQKIDIGMRFMAISGEVSADTPTIVLYRSSKPD